MIRLRHASRINGREANEIILLNSHARAFLGDWQGSLICDDYSGYKACFTQGVTEVGCMAHVFAASIRVHRIEPE